MNVRTYMYMCVCVCVYIYIYVRCYNPLVIQTAERCVMVYIYTHTYIHIHTHTHVYFFNPSVPNTCPAHLIYPDRPNISLAAQINSLSSFLQPPITSLMANCLPQKYVLEHCRAVFCSYCQRPSLHTVKPP